VLEIMALPPLPPPPLMMLFFSWKLWQCPEDFPCPQFYSEKIFEAHLSVQGVGNLPHAALLTRWAPQTHPAGGSSVDPFSPLSRHGAVPWGAALPSRHV